MTAKTPSILVRLDPRRRQALGEALAQRNLDRARKGLAPMSRNELMIELLDAYIRRAEKDKEK